MKKSISMILSAFLLVEVLTGIYRNDAVNATEIPMQKEDIIQNETYTTIDKDGNVQIHQYEEDHVKTLQSNEYQVVMKNENESEVLATFDTYEEAHEAIESRKQMSTFTNDDNEFDVETIADTKDIQYGVARIIGFINYKEFDGSIKGRTGYTHGTSANDAAYLSTSEDGKTIRVKQAGIVMDIPVTKKVKKDGVEKEVPQIEVVEFASDSKVSYYQGENGIFYHYYYSGSYGTNPKLNATQVGYTPDYLKDGVKYYSYDGHYFYTDYKVMCDDYRKNVHAYPHAINADKPYYNYYQYLSFRSQTQFKPEHFNKLITDQKGMETNSKLKDQGQALLNNQDKHGTNASLMLGVAINESGWGLSKYSQERNNLFGIGAVDSNPDAAYRFETVEECFNYFSHTMISSGYLDCEDSRYRGPHLGDKQSGINVKYASDPYWGEKAASFSYRLNKDNENIDYQKYQLAIAKEGILYFYNMEDKENDFYNSGATDRTNKNVYNFPVTILSEGKNTYKILSDSILTDDRKMYNPNSEQYNVDRDYVFVRKDKVNKVGEVIAKNYLPGDVNGDDKVSSLDYIQVKNHIMETKVLTGESLYRADVNKDGKVSSLDYIKIKNHIMGANLLF